MGLGFPVIGLKVGGGVGLFDSVSNVTFAVGEDEDDIVGESVGESVGSGVGPSDANGMIPFVKLELELDELELDEVELDEVELDKDGD